MFYISWIDMVGLFILGLILGYLCCQHFIPYLKKVREEIKAQVDNESARSHQIRLFLTELEGYLEKMYVGGILQTTYMRDFKAAGYQTAHELLSDSDHCVFIEWVGTKTYYVITVKIDELFYELKAPWDIGNENPGRVGITFYPIDES